MTISNCTRWRPNSGNTSLSAADHVVRRSLRQRAEEGHRQRNETEEVIEAQRLARRRWAAERGRRIAGDGIAAGKVEAARSIGHGAAVPGLVDQPDIGVPGFHGRAAGSCRLQRRSRRAAPAPRPRPGCGWPCGLGRGCLSGRAPRGRRRPQRRAVRAHRWRRIRRLRKAAVDEGHRRLLPCRGC